MRAVLQAGLVFVAVFAAVFAAILLTGLWRGSGISAAVAISALSAVISALAQVISSVIGGEQVSIMRRGEQRDLQRDQRDRERAGREVPRLEATVKFKARSELPTGVSADGRFNALITLENHGLGTAENVTVTASRERGEPAVYRLGTIRSGDTRMIALPLELDMSIQATATTMGRSIVIDYDGASSSITFQMTQTHPPGWGPASAGAS
jgi:hypothetical protein